MKSLLALLSVGLLLGLLYWKTEHPDAGVDDIKAGASGGLDRVKTGFTAFAEGGDGNGTGVTSGGDTSELAGRLDNIEAEFSEAQNAFDPAATQSRIESLEAALVETQQAAADPAVINGRLTDAERRMTASEAKISAYKQTLDSLSGSVNTDGNTTIQVSDIEARLIQLSENIETQKETISSFDSKLSALETGTNQELSNIQKQLNRKLSMLETGTNLEIETLEDESNKKLSMLETGTNQEIATLETEVDKKLSALETGTNVELGLIDSASSNGASTGDAEQIALLKNELSTSQTKVRALEQTVDNTNQQLAALSSSLNDLRIQVGSSSIDDQQAQIRAQLEQLQNQVTLANDNTNVATLSSSLQATRDRIKSLEQQVVDLPESSTAANDAAAAQKALEAQIIALEQKLANVQASPDPTLANTISEVEEKVSELASKSYVTQEDLRAQQEAQSVEYRVYFDRNSTAITEDAANTLRAFIDTERERTSGVAIYGFTDRRGSATYNQQLALQRATNVRSFLIQNGFSYTKIQSLSGLGEDAAAAVIADGQEDAQQRAVVLYAQQ